MHRITRGFVQSGCDLVRAFGWRALPLVSDTRDAQAVKALVDQIMYKFGRADFIVNNASSPRGYGRVPVIELAVDVSQRD